jgi:hypothetical protein
MAKILQIKKMPQNIYIRKRFRKERHPRVSQMAAWKLIPLDIPKIISYPRNREEFLISYTYGDPRIRGSEQILLIPEKPISPIPQSPPRSTIKKEEKASQTISSRISRGVQTSPSPTTREISTSTEELELSRSEFKSPRTSRPLTNSSSRYPWKYQEDRRRRRPYY